MLIVITGPSGVGKTTVMKSLLNADRSLKYAPSLTTRKPRPIESNGVDYHFVSEDEFLQLVRNNKFAEWSRVYDNYYGRLRDDLDTMIASGDVVVSIDIQGAMKLKEKYPDGVFIFLLPRSEQALEAQLRGRGTDDENSIRTRLEAAVREMQQADSFNHVVVNNKVQDTVRKIESILASEREKRQQQTQG